MKKYLCSSQTKFFLPIFNVVIMLASILLVGPTALAEDETVSEIRDVKPFHSIELRGNGTMYVKQGPVSEVRLEGAKGVIDAHDTSVQMGRLIVQVKFLKRTRVRKPIKVYVTNPHLKGLAVSGSGAIFGQSDISAEKFRLKISGSGKIDLALTADFLETRISGSGQALLKGSAQKHHLVVAGSGQLKTFELASHHVNIKISGSGICEVAVIDKLEIKVSGSGTIKYRGNPDKIYQQISGSGSVRKME